MPESNSESNSSPESNLASKVRALDVVEAKILYYKCEGMKYRSLRTLLNVSQDDLEAATARLYLKLGLDLKLHARSRDRVLRVTFCPVLNRLLANLPGEKIAKFAHWPPAAPMLVVPIGEPPTETEPGNLVLYGYDRALAVVRQEVADETIVDPPDIGGSDMRLLPGGSNSLVTKGQPGRSGRVIAVLWLLSLCLVAGLVGGGAYLLSLRTAPAPGGTTQIVVTATILPATATVPPSQTAAVITSVPTSEPSPFATQTAWVITATPVPATETPASSATPAPTNTPTLSS